MKPTRSLFSYLLLALSLSACSGQFLLPGKDGLAVNTIAPVAEQKTPESIIAGPAPNDSPCTQLRYSMGRENVKGGFMRCNVVLNPQVNPESKYAVREADLCFAMSEFVDRDKRTRAHAELSGTLVRLEDTSTKQQLQNLPVRSSRVNDEPYRRPSGLEFSETKSTVRITDQAQLSGAKQSLEFDPEKKELHYQVYEKEPIFLGLVDKPVDSLHARLLCNEEQVYLSATETASVK